MKRFIAVLNDGSFINVPATRMEIKDESILVYDGTEVVVYADVGFTLSAYISDRKDDCK
jgi:hypothetical protein